MRVGGSHELASQVFCGELMLNFLVQVGALFLLTKWVLYVVV